MFYWNSLAFPMIQQMFVIWSLVPLPFLNSACTSGSTWFMYFWSLAWIILSITVLAFEISATVWMISHSSTLARKILWMEEPGRLQSMGSWRVRHDWATSLSLFTFMHWRRQWQPTPVFLPGESQGWWSLVGCHLWGRTESDTTEVT